MHPPVEAGESLYIMYEACIHALEGAQDPHDYMVWLNFFFILSVFLGFVPTNEPWYEGVGTETS
jgi:hypothetical protein